MEVPSAGQVKNSGTGGSLVSVRKLRNNKQSWKTIERENVAAIEIEDLKDKCMDNFDQATNVPTEKSINPLPPALQNPAPQLSESGDACRAS